MTITGKTHGAIAAGHSKTAEAGIEMLRLGGNAFDAVVAAMLASFVVEFNLTSLGGGGFLLAHTASNQNILFDFFTQTPGRRSTATAVDFYPVHINFGGATQEFHIGLGSIAVPGNIAGVFHVHQKLGSLPFKVIAEPAIHFAQNGVELDAFQAYCLRLLQPIMTGSSAGRQMFAPQGELLQPTEKVVMRELAQALTHLAEKGPQEFYQGDIAQQLIQGCQAYGGYLTLEDLRSYHVLEREPLSIQYRGNTLLTNPPPSSGGTLIAFTLELLSKIDLSAVQFGSLEHLQILAQVMRLTNEARRDGYDANIYEPEIAQRFLASDHLAQYSNQLTQTTNKWGSTTHISVVDQAGNASSVTTSNGEGSSYMIPGTGIMMNNMLGEEDLNPHGFHQWQANRRISSMMAPTIVLKDSRPEIVLGSGGSNRIRTAILQVISNILDFQMDVKTAVDSPRVHWENSTFNLEPGFATIHDSAFPTEKLVTWQQQSMFFGGVHTIQETATGQLEGAGDRRRSGVVMTC